MARGRIGRPFEKGQSGNPGGRPRKVGDVKEKALGNSTAAIMKLVELMDSKDPRVALAACREVLDRAVGRPAQEGDTLGGDPTITIVIPPIDDDDDDDEPRGLHIDAHGKVTNIDPSRAKDRSPNAARSGKEND